MKQIHLYFIAKLQRKRSVNAKDGRACCRGKQARPGASVAHSTGGALETAEPARKQAPYIVMSTALLTRKSPKAGCVNM